MQCVIYSPEIFSWQKQGGVSRYFAELIPAVIASGWQVEVCAGLYSNDLIEYLRSTGTVSGYDVSCCGKLGKLGRTFLSLSNSLAFNVQNHNNDVVHQTYYSPFARRNGRLVVTVYDLILEKMCSGQQGRGSKIARHASIHAAEKIIAISEATRNDLLDYYDIPPNRVDVIHLGVRLPENLPSQTEKCDATPPYLLYVGVRTGYKNFEKFVRAYATSGQLRSTFKLVCFGGGPFSAEELNLFSSLTVNDSVGWLEGNDALLSKYYRDATMLVYPSLYEGFGLPVLEAMANGCPVACSNTSSLPEVGGDAAYYFSPDDIDSIRYSIECAVSDICNLRKKIQDGFRRAKSFSWQETARKTINIYNQVLEGDKYR
ncbi:MAG: glycosyltransferase family 1 protein [Geobacteraceae bacterium]|nr:glycosyltransferase family 1 protein [Geobacteraceae bacterium]